MSKRFSVLRSLDERVVAQEACVRAAQQVGIALSTAWLAPHVPYLRFQLEHSQGITCGWIRANTWAEARCPVLAGIAWTALDDSEMQQFVAATPDPLQFASHPALGRVRVLFLDLQVPTTARLMACLSSHEGDVLIDEATWCLTGAKTRRLADLPVVLELQVATIAIRMGLLRRVRRGDALLCTLADGTGRIGGRTIFHFQVNGEHAIVIDWPETHVVESHDEPSDGVDLGDIELDVSVVLMRKQCTVNELGGLEPGSCIAIGEDAYRRVELHVSGRRIAMGELVQLGDRLAVQIERTWLA